MDDEDINIPVKDKTVNVIENTLEDVKAENKNQDSPSTTKTTHETHTEATTENTVGTDLTNCDTIIETINTPVGGADTNPATKKLVETETKKNIKEYDRPLSTKFEGDVSETTPTTDIHLVATNITFETDYDKKEEYTEDTMAPTTTTKMHKSHSEETSNVDETGEDTHTPIEETEESPRISPSQQEEDTTITTTAAETAKTQESPPQEEYIDEAAAAPLSHEEGTAHHTNMEAEGSSLSQQEEDTTITTTAETQESPPQGEHVYVTAVEVATEDNLPTSEAGPHSSQQDQADNTSSSQTEDGNNITSATEAGDTPEAEHFYIEGHVGDTRRRSTQQQNRSRRYLQIAIGVVSLIIIGLGMGIGLLWVNIDKYNKEFTTTDTTAISTTETTTVEETTTPIISTTTETEGTTTPEKTTSPTTAPPNFISKAEMHKFTKGLVDLDDNNKGNKLKVNHQDKIEEGWVNQTWGPLIEFKNHALEGPTLEPFVALLNNYVAAVGHEETTTDDEIQEQKEFLDAVMTTNIMIATEEFMRNYTFDVNLRDYLQQIWFTPYSRSWTGVNDTSGFEHTFVGEQKEGHVLGFQNWVNFGLQEECGNLTYKGWKRSIALKPFSIIPSLKKKGEIIELSFEWQNNTRSLDFMFIGTSPELEMALYTLCYWAKVSKKCPVQLNNHRIVIHTSDYGGLGVVGSAYPDISYTII